MNSVEICHIDNIKGKGLFAKQFFEAGSVIIEEDPTVCSQLPWNAAYSYKACDHCLKPLETAQENARRLTNNSNLTLPYPECCITNKATIETCPVCSIEYCSSECRINAFNQYHRTLCTHTSNRLSQHPLDQLRETWKQIHYPPETSTIMLIPRILATIQQSADPELTKRHFLNFSHGTVNENSQLAHKLLGAKFANQINVLHNLLNVAISPLHVEDFLTMEGFHSLLALMGRNQQGVGSSPISQWVTRTSELTLSDSDKLKLDDFIDQLYAEMDRVTGSFLNSEGVALYALQSACNHSCEPNAECAFVHNNSRLSVVAQKNINPGDEICISYLDECALDRSRHSRQKMLAENYLFVCNCPKCLNEINNPDVTSEESEGEEMDE